MSVLIRGMEMPKSCDECPLYTCMHNHDNCPLVPVPPHGRLIDADALKSEIAEEDDGFGHDVYTAGIHDGFALSFECIDEAPTVIPAEEGET